MLIIEDDPIVVETLTTYLEHAGFDVIATGDGADGLARAQSPDVAMVILDWMVPGMNGPEVCRRLRAVSIGARADAHGAHRRGRPGARPRNRRRRLRAQAVQPARGRRARAGLAPAQQRRAGRQSDATADAVGALEVDHFKREVRVGGTLVALTPTEFRLVEALATHPGRTFSREELVARAFGPDYDGLDRTVDTHVTNLRRKLDAGRRHSLIHTVHGVGYRLMVQE